MIINEDKMKQEVITALLLPNGYATCMSIRISGCITHIQLNRLKRGFENVNILRNAHTSLRH